LLYLFVLHAPSAPAVYTLSLHDALPIFKAGVLTPSDPAGAPLIPSAPVKPIRYWFEMGDQDLFYPNPTIPDGMHDWTGALGISGDRKSTRLNSSHVAISYAVFCLKKKKT